MAELGPQPVPARRVVLRTSLAGFARRPLGLLAAALCLPAAALVPRSSRAAALSRKEVKLADFDRLVLEVPAGVRIAIADGNHARIEAEPSVIDAIAFETGNRTLRVFAARSFQTRQPIAISITCRRLLALEAQASVDATLAGLVGEGFTLLASGSATVALERLNLSSIEADIDGSATVTVGGKVKSQTVSIGGAGTYDAANLKSQSTRVVASGSSDAVINSRDSLDVVVSGAATVHYAGNPTLKQVVEGAGTLDQL